MKQTISKALKQQGYNSLTPVQEAVTKAELAHDDLLVSAQTGSGKTVGFGLAIAPTLLGDAERFEKASTPLALIIAPTRELAMQVKRELTWLYAQTGAVVVSCVGGMDMRNERRALAQGAHIVVATPGRLRDHIMRGSMDMATLRAVVLDEADEMLDLGFREELEFILGEAPEHRRTLLFSATVPRQIANLAKKYQRDAVRIVTSSDNSQHADIAYRAMQVSPRDSENAIINVLRFYEAPNALVFCNTRAAVNRLTTRFSNRGFSVVALSGELSQNERTHALQAMRDGRARVCVATDVAARGIDLPSLELVIHADLPSNAETLLHRSGRTGRAGRKGVSALIVPPKARRKAESLLRLGKLNAEWCQAPSADAVKERDQMRLMADPAWAMELSEDEIKAARHLIDKFSAEQIAAAYLRLYHAGHSAPEELSPADDVTPPKPRAAFGPSVWFSIPGGRSTNAEPRRLLPMLCKAGGITKEDIGAIRIQPKESFVEISKSRVPEFLKNIGTNLRVEGGVTLTQLETPPLAAQTGKPKFQPKEKPEARPTGRKGTPGPSGKKPKNAATGQRSKNPKRPEETRPDGVVTSYKGKRKKSGKPGVNLAPKVGKPSSKKNRARAAAAKAAKKGKSGAVGSGQGGAK